MPTAQTSNFGVITYNPDAAIEFPRGLPGFDDRRRFVVLQFPDTAPLTFLQSLDASELCFISMPVLAVDPDYRLEVSIAHIGRSRVKVGIRAPRQTPVIAREIKLVRDQNLAAAQAAAGPDLPNLLKRLSPH